MITKQEIIERSPEATPDAAEKLAEIANKHGATFEQIEAASKALARVAVTVKKIAEGMLKIARGIEETIRTQATKKELHLMLHAKKRRTRKKYANRIARRAAALINKRRRE